MKIKDQSDGEQRWLEGEVNGKHNFHYHHHQALFSSSTGSVLTMMTLKGMADEDKTGCTVLILLDFCLKR